VPLEAAGKLLEAPTLLGSVDVAEVLVAHRLDAVERPGQLGRDGLEDDVAVEQLVPGEADGPPGKARQGGRRPEGPAALAGDRGHDLEGRLARSGNRVSHGGSSDHDERLDDVSR
jgi:hypothetical protein